MEHCRLSLVAANQLSIALAAAYVGSLYVIPKRLQRLHRDHPRHIRARVAAVTVASVLSAAVFVPCCPPPPFTAMPLPCHCRAEKHKEHVTAKP